jgi:hypothetical protein
VVEGLVAAVDREARFSWDAPDAGLSLTRDGRLDAGGEYEPSRMEREGFRSLVLRYNECFPRAAGLLAGLSAPTVAAVWREAFRPGAGGRLQVVERTGEGGEAAMFAVYAPGYPSEYTVATVAETVRDALGSAPHLAHLQYDAPTSSLSLRVELPDYHLHIVATDTYGEPAPSVSVYTLQGRNLGAPNVGPARRRRPGTGGTSTSEGIIEKIYAAAAHVRAHT